MRRSWFLVESDGYDVWFTPENADRFLVKLSSLHPLPAEGLTIANKIHEWLTKNVQPSTPSKDDEGPSKS